MRTVLVSVTDKTGLESFIRKLERFEPLRLIGTTSTAAFLRERGFQCAGVEELTGFPEILSGRVKTLHPRVFAGILSRPSQEDRSCLKELEISEIDMVVVNLYAFEDKLTEELSEMEMIEQIDIGGVALLRAAAKNYQRVAVVSSPAQYEEVVASLDANGGEVTAALRKSLALAAFSRTASYDASISAYLRGVVDGEKHGDGKAMPERAVLQLARHQKLRYGENPHQSAAWYAPPVVSPPIGEGAATAAAFPPFDQLQGKELSANNITDIYALLRILNDIRSPGACIIKHNNPCGVATGSTISEAFEKAYGTDPVSAFGGIYGFTEPVDGKLAAKIVEGFVEIVLAPGFAREAMESFRKKKNLRVLQWTVDRRALAGRRRWRVKHLEELGVIVEVDDEPPAEPDSFQCVTETKVEEKHTSDIAFAWSVVRHLTSNAIFVAGGGRSLGFGIGQTSRIASVNLALAQAGEGARSAVLASDAFFPATDNIEAAAAAGIAVIVQPGGSLKDADVIAACNRAGIAMLFTGQRCFKH